MKSFFYMTFFLLLLVCTHKSFADCGDSVVVVITNSTGVFGSSTSKTKSIFNPAGQLKSRTHSVWQGNTWKNQSRIVNIYDSVGHVLQYVVLMANDFEGWDTSSINYKTYNSHGDITESLYLTSWNGPLQNASRTIYTYDVFYNLIELADFTWQNSAWSNHHRFLYYPDTNGNDTLVISEYGDTTTWSNYERTYSFFNASNQHIHDSIQHWHLVQQLWWFSGENFYNYNGSLIDSFYYAAYNFNGALNSSGYQIFQYDSLNRESTVDYFQWNNSQWNYYGSDSTYYDVWGNTIRSAGMDGIFDWVYDSLGNLLHFDEVGPAMSPYSVDYYYSGTVLTSSTFMSQSQGGNVTTGSSTYYYADIEGGEFTCGHPVELFAIPCSPNHQYLWSNGSTDASIIVNGSGTYNLTVTFPSGFVAAAPPFAVHAANPPALNLGNDTTVCYDESVLLDAGPGYAYNWSNGSQSQTLLALSAVPDSNYYSVMITDTNGCTSTDSILVVFDNCLQTSQLESGFIFYPNPANETMNLNLLSPEKNVTLHVLDALGKEQLNFENISGEFQFSTSTLAPGIYFLQLEENGGRALIKKLVISRN